MNKIIVVTALSVFMLALALSVGILVGRLRENAKYEERTAALEQRAKDNAALIEAMQEKRCVNIETPVVHVSVYSTPNLGVHKVEKRK